MSLSKILSLIIHASMDTKRTLFSNAIVLFMASILFASCCGIDIINQTHFISDSKNESLISSIGNFKLGFFSPGNSPSRYVGIWFNKVSKQTVVWVANREIPLKKSAGIFKIAADGNLAVVDSKGRTPLWSTNISMPNANSSAKLLPSGNLVLVVKNNSGNSESIVWQSFDYPTDTILPGMRFGLNRETGLNQFLTSWKSSDDPAPGDFSFGLNPNGSPQYFLYRNLTPFWRVGPWNGRSLSGTPDISTGVKSNRPDFSNEAGFLNYSFVSNKQGTYITFYLRNTSVFSSMVLEPTGIVKRVTWREDSQDWALFWLEPDGSCDVYANCGSYSICNFNNAIKCSCLPGFEPLSPHDWHTCVEKRKFQCGKGAGEGFLKIANVKIPDATRTRAYTNLSLKECEMECLRSCNCSGYASLDINNEGQGCLAWYGELNDMQQYTDEGQDFHLRVEAGELAAYAKNSSKSSTATNWIVRVIVLFAIALLLLFVSIYLHSRKKRARKGHLEKRRRCELLSLDPENRMSNSEDLTSAHECEENLNITFYDLGTIRAATDNFSSERKLGEGGFGPVYKGKLSNGKEVAIKRLSKSSEQGIDEFKNEVLLIAKLQHRNLVKLLGCCIEAEEKMLIYEYMPNKSLDYLIFDQSRKASLEWEKRFEIIMGIARGILYLHQDSRLRIIHRDLKTSNVLLDEEMNAKISDFGTARIFCGNQNQANTNRVVGTFGYMSPEYALDGLFSVKSDVFSFGVLLLEIISGRKNIGFFKEDLSSNLIRYTWNLWKDGNALEMMDLSIRQSCPSSEVLRCIHVGLLCVQDCAANRPTMSEIIFMLSTDTTLPSPTQPTFSITRSQNDPSFPAIDTSSSVNQVTISLVDAR
ncbi:hypothetical protein POPTR_011G035600v4 [Populus trichocarpa]|uniref:Receptor-like serine/threonine-protein kinase n=1 Tax=Populus trichocarpa TaxID=3694 RepID=A0A2K1YF38_POPTR|nr:G-type lectin S-receptor-like serine/threonine-protein kinase At4g27290 [Populus trichocarpa]PNT11648.1 hypothetical protein POPTR_011G035600v4 [Populus trichocarpa]|eukprot:XP_024437403.1 G-type lectin S-receptor-like serine/threonine-protein kinase At4g27290 [Populus trichocarpa]